MLREFVIQPNCSLSLRGRNYFLWSIGVIMGVISSYMASRGLWLITPFMGGELMILVYAFDKVAKQCRVIERVVIEEDNLTIHQLTPTKQPRQIGIFPLYWVQVELRNNSHPWYKSKLLIGSYGRWVELATFLTNEERSSLADALKIAIIAQRQPAREERACR